MFFIVAPFDFCGEIAEIIEVELSAVLLPSYVGNHSDFRSVAIDDF